MIALSPTLRGFAHEHDEIPAFHAAFLVVTILSAAVFNLGFFGLGILAHMALDYVKYRDVHHLPFRITIKAMFLESIGDIALFLIALTFAVYLNHTYMLSLLSGMLRSELTLLRAFGTLLPKIRMVENFLALALNFRAYMHTPHAGLKRPLSRLERLSLRTIIVCSFLLIAAFFLFWSHEWDLIAVLRHELIPML